LSFIIGFGAWENKGTEQSSAAKSPEMMRFNIEFVFWEGGVLNDTARYLTNTQQGRVELHKCRENMANSLWKRKGRGGVNVNNWSSANLYTAPVI
jgi:hypothetical protein